MLIVFLTLKLAFASQPSLLQDFPSQILRHEIVEFKAVKDHHLSLEAPQSCATGTLVERSARLIRCQFGIAGLNHPRLNVCDDKKTFCKPIEIKIQVAEALSKTPQVLVKNQSLNQRVKSELTPGFIEGSLEELKTKSQKLGKPVLIMVSTDWCPPCNEVKEHLFRNPEFQKLSVNWFKIYIDGDRLESANWRKQFGFNFYPTLILANAQLQEVARYSGAPRWIDFEAWAKESLTHLNDPIDSLRRRVMGRLRENLWGRLKNFWSVTPTETAEREIVRLLRWALIRRDRDLIETLLPLTKSPELAVSMTQFRLENEEDPIAKIGFLQNLIDLQAGKSGWSESVAQLCEIDGKTCEPYLAEASVHIENLKKKPGLNDVERAFTLGEESYYLSIAFEKAGAKGSHAKWSEICVDFLGRVPKEQRQTRSVAQLMVPCLERAGKTARAEKELLVLIRKYPNEPTFLSRLGRVKRKENKFSEALALFNQAEKLAFGFNWLSLQALKAEVLLDLKREEEARRVVQAAIAEIRLEPSPDSASQIHLARLRALEFKIR